MAETNVLPEYRPKLQAWAEEVLRGRFGENQTAWARKAGVRKATLGLLVNNGTTSPPTLGKLADAVEESREEVFRIAGWLYPKTADVTLTRQEKRIVDLLRHLPEGLQDAQIVAITGSLEALHRTTRH